MFNLNIGVVRPTEGGGIAPSPSVYEAPRVTFEPIPEVEEDEDEVLPSEIWGAEEDTAPCYACPMVAYPHCPVFILSKGRYDVERGTIGLLVQDCIPFAVVVEADEEERYSRLLDSLVFKFFGSEGMNFGSEAKLESEEDRSADQQHEGEAKTCACCSEVGADSFANLVSTAYHHGYVFEPLRSAQERAEQGTRSAAFSLTSVEAVRALFKVEVLPEMNKGVSYVRNYILHVLAPRIMVSCLMDESGSIEELDVVSAGTSETIAASSLRRWGLGKSFYDGLEKRAAQLAEKHSPSYSPVHALVGYYWVFDDDINSFITTGADKGERTSPRNVMCEVERRVMKLKENALKRPASPNTHNPNLSVFSCKEEAMMKNTISSPFLTLDTYDRLPQTAIISLEYSRYTFYRAYGAAAIAVNSYNNIACLFRYDLLHDPVSKSVKYFPPNASGVRTFRETLVGYMGAMMWYRFAIREDYDFTLQLIARGMYTLRFRNIGFDVPQMSKLRGGMTDYYKNCQSDIQDQNNRFVEQWPSVSQHCLKGKNETERQDIRVRWDLLHPSRARHPGAFLYLLEPPLAARSNPVVVKTEPSGQEPAQRPGPSTAAPPLSHSSASSSFKRERNPPSPTVIEGESSADNSKRRKTSSTTPPLEETTTAVPPIPVLQSTAPKQQVQPSSHKSDSWKGFAVERWRDVQPSEAIQLGLKAIPPSLLAVGRTVAIIPPSFSDSPSIVQAVLVDKNVTVARHCSLCGPDHDDDQEIIEWSAVATKVRGMPMQSVIYCYEIPTEPLSDVASRIDKLLGEAP